MLYQQPPNSGFLCPHFHVWGIWGRSFVYKASGKAGLHNHESFRRFRKASAQQFLSKLISSISLASFPISCSVALRIIENNLYAQNIGWLGLDSYSLQLGYSHLINRSQISAHFLYSQLWVSSLVNLNSRPRQKVSWKLDPVIASVLYGFIFLHFGIKVKFKKKYSFLFKNPSISKPSLKYWKRFILKIFLYRFYFREL